LLCVLIQINHPHKNNDYPNITPTLALGTLCNPEKMVREHWKIDAFAVEHLFRKEEWSAAIVRKQYSPEQMRMLELRF